MCADLNMPNPMAQHTFQEHLASIKSAAEVAAKQSMDIGMEQRNAMDVHGDKQRWQRCPKTVFSGRDHLDYRLMQRCILIVEKGDMGSYFHYWDLILVSTLQNYMRLAILDASLRVLEKVLRKEKKSDR